MSDYQVRYFEFGDFRLDTAERVLLRKDERIPLTHRSYQLLLTLIQNKGHLLRHEELIQLVWNETAVDHANLKQNIALIRKALGDGNMDSQFIQTVPKFGYRFVAPVNLLPDENIALITERKSVMQIDFEEELSDEKSLVRTKRENFSGRSFYKIAITGLFVFIFILIPIWFFTRQNPVNKPNNFSIENITPRKLTDSGNVELGALSPNGEFAVYTTLDMEKESILWLRQIDSRDSIKLVSLTAPERIGAFSITNDGKWIYFVSIKNGDWGKQASLFKVSILGGKTQKITDYIDSFVSFSPDDSSFVFNRFTENGCQLITANALDGSNEKIIAQGKTNLEFLEPKWSPDGSEILFFSVEHQSEGNFSNLSTISVETGKVEQIIRSDKRRFLHLAWTKNGEIIVNAVDSTTKLPQIYTVSKENNELKRITNDLFYYNGISVGGSSILATKKERSANIWISDAENLNREPQNISETATIDSINWFADGQNLIYEASNSGKRHLWKTNIDGSRKEQISPEAFDEIFPDVSPDGKFITFLSNRGGTYELWICESDGSRPRQITSGNTRIWQPRLSSDGNFVFYNVVENNEILLMKVSVQGGQPQIVISGEIIELFDLSPDGKLLAYSFSNKQTEETKVNLFSLETNQIIKTFEISPTRFLKFTPDGKNLIFKNQNTQTAPISSIWKQPLDDSQPIELIDFKKDDVYWAKFSPDGKKLVSVRGKLTSDLILLSTSKN